MFKKSIAIVVAVFAVSGLQLASAESDSRFPYCVSASSDSDGDGYGWENQQTCLVTTGASGGSYTVSVTNLTYQQVFSPVIAVTHDNSVALIEAGQSAGAGVTAIAEGGDTSVLEGELSGLSVVHSVAVSPGPLPYGQSVSYDIEGAPGQVISFLSMLVNTNDALVVVDSLYLPTKSGDSVMSYAVAYDAGTETNDELCAHIPGPACGGAGGSPDDDGEGFVHVHRGLQGVGDLNAVDQSWLNPVAVVHVTRN